ncbi:hypothetical protein MYX84_14210, partial [Acidobacteria bacterium AH-259-O06]|nr:hypothetical protein [Acidobacteria bacterium AH-259-O06]
MKLMANTIEELEKVCKFCSKYAANTVPNSKGLAHKDRVFNNLGFDLLTNASPLTLGEIQKIELPSAVSNSMPPIRI